MKILITTDWYKPVINGVVASVLNLADGLRTMGHEVRILTLSEDSHTHTDGNVIRLASISVGAIYPNARFKTTPAGRYLEELAEWSPDVVHSQCEFSTYFLAKKIAETCHCPLIHTYHTDYEDFTHYFSPSVRVGRRMAASYSRAILRNVQAAVAPTEKIRRMLLGYGVTCPVYVIPSGLCLNRFTEKISPEERRSMRASLGIAEDEILPVYLGRLAREKNVEELLAFLSLPENASYRLLVVGDGPFRPQLEKMTQDLGMTERVIFTGMVKPEETARYYQLGDIFVSASKSESQGLTYMEAAAVGLPLLCHEDPCLTDVIVEGVNGFTYRDATTFHQKLSQLRTDAELRSRMGNAAREFVFRNYSIPVFARRILGVYQDAIRQAETDRKAGSAEEKYSLPIRMEKRLLTWPKQAAVQILRKIS